MSSQLRLRARLLIARVSQGHAENLIRERLIHFSTLDRGLRIVVFGAYGLLAIIAVLIAFHRKFDQTPTLSSVGLILPRGTLAVSTPFFLIALALILTGIMLSNATLRYTLVALASLFLLPVGYFARKGLVCCDTQQ